MQKLITIYCHDKERFVEFEYHDAQNDAKILNNNVLFKIADYLGISWIYESINEKVDNIKKLITPCNSDIFPNNVKVQLIQDFR